MKSIGLILQVEDVALRIARARNHPEPPVGQRVLVDAREARPGRRRIAVVGTLGADHELASGDVGWVEGTNVYRARQPALVQVGGRRFVDIHRVDEVGGDDAEVKTARAERTRPRRGGDIPTIWGDPTEGRRAAPKTHRPGPPAGAGD